MSLDAVKNFAASTVATAPSPATTGLTLILAAGGGLLMPAVPFDAVAAPAGAAPTAATAEIITVTAIATDTLTFTRQSQTSNLQSIATGWTITVGTTAKTITDLTLSQAKVYNVKDYGAKGDGTTNDAVAIQNALTAASGLGNAFFPAGTYLVNAPLNVPSNTYISGAGSNSSVIKQGFAASGVDTNGMLKNSDQTAGNSFIFIRDIKLLTTATTGTLPNLATSTCAIQFKGASDVALHNVFSQNGTLQFQPLPAFANTANCHTTGKSNRVGINLCRVDSGAEGIYFQQGTDLNVTNTTLTNCYDSTLSINSSGERINLNNVICDGKGLTWSSLGLMEFTNDGAGDTNGIRDVSITGVVLLNSMNANTKGIVFQRVNNATVTGAEIRNVGDAGIRIAGGVNITVTGNTMTSCGNNGVYVTNDYATNGAITLSGNTCSGNTGSGIALGGAALTLDTVTISGNTCSGNSSWGINPLANVTAGTITANTLRNNTSGSINTPGLGWSVLNHVGGKLGVNTPAPTFGYHQTGGSSRLQSVATPAAPSTAVSGVAGTTTYTYYVVAIDAAGNKTLVSPAGTTATGNAVLSASNFVTVSWIAVVGAVSYDVLKTNTATSLALSGIGTSVADTGQATAAYTAPIRNATADLTIDGVLNPTGAVQVFNKILGTQAANILDIQPGPSSYTRMLDQSGNVLQTLTAGEGSSSALYKATGTTYLQSWYTSADATVLGGRIDGSGKMALGAANPNSSAQLDMQSTTAGFLPPRLTTTQKNAIASPATGLLVYDITLVGLYSYNGTAWVAVTGAGGTAPKPYTYTVAATGGDYTTLQACLAVAPAGSAIKVVGTVTETVATSCTTSNISISGDSESVVVLLDQAANTFSMGGNYWAIRNLNFQAGVSDKGSDATAWIKITGNYNRFSGNTITEKASTTTNFGSSVDLTNLKYSQVDRNVFLSVNKGGSMFYDSTAFRHDIIISGNSFWASAGKAFYVLSTVAGPNDIDGITIIGNTGQAASINATYAMIDMNASSSGNDYFVNVNIENNHFRLVGTGKLVSFGTTSGQNRAIRVCSNSGRSIDTALGCGDIFVNNFNASTISDNTCGNIQAYFMTNSVFSNNTSEIGGFTTGGNNLGSGNLVSANVFNTLLISNATRCSISNNYTPGNFEVDQSTSCTIQGNTVFGSSGLQILNDNRSIISGNFSQSAAITITGTLTTEYGNATGPATGIISTITTPGPLATTSRLVLGNSETHNWKTKGVSYTMTAGDFGIIATAAITVTLPSGTVAGIGYQAEIAPNGFAVTVAATAGTVQTTALSGQVAGKYVSDGTNWISR